jgi:hypothetical protein
MARSVDPPRRGSCGLHFMLSASLGALSDLDLLWSLNPNLIGWDNRFQRTVEVSAALLVYFMEIHPYGDGNGHMGRLRC